MFEYEGSEYTLEEVTKAAEDKKLSVEDYVSKFNLKEIKTEQPVGKPNDVVVEDATVTSEPEQASESMELEPVNYFLAPPSQILEKGKFVSTPEGAVYAEKGEAILAQPEEGAFAPIALEEVVITANQYKEREQQEENEAAKKLIELTTGIPQLTEEQVLEQKEKEGELTSITEFEEAQRISSGEIAAREKRQEERLKKDLGFQESVFNSLTNGLGQVAGVDDRAKWLVNYIGSQEDLVRNIFSEETANKILKSSSKGLGEATLEIDRLNSYSAPVQQFTDIKIEEGLIPVTTKGIAGVIDGITSFGASALTATTTFGTGLASDMISASIKDFNETKAESLGINVDELIKSGQSNFLTPAALGSFGYSLERLGIKGVTNYIRGLSNPGAKGLFNLINVGTKEGGTELAQLGIETYNTALASGEKNPEAVAMDAMFSKEGLEVLLKGAAGGKGVALGGNALRAMTAVRNTGENKRIADNIRKLNDLENSKFRKNLSESEIGIINQQQEQIRKDLGVILDKSENIVTSLTEDQINSINNNFDFLTSSSSEIQAINNSKKYTDQDKKVLIEGIEQQRKIASQEIYDIRNEAEKLQGEISKVKKVSKLVKGVSVQDFANASEINSFLKEKGLDKDFDTKASEQQGFIIQNPETGEQTIVINRDVASKEKAMNVAGHELGHAILFKTVKDSPETAINLGNALLNELDKIDADQIKDSKFKKRMDLYKDQKVEVQMEEALTLFSDALATGDIKFNENVFTKIGDQIRRVMQMFGVKVKFNTGRDVYNFIKDYNKSLEKGDLSLSQVEAAAKGVKGALVKDAVKEAETIIKESRSEEASQEVQRIYEEQGEAGAFDIIEQFKPITNKIVDRRRDAPGFNREDLTSEIELGKRGILDLIKEYDAESGVPLAAYINKFLPARAIEASNRILGEQFTEDVTEARGVAAEEVVAEVVEERVARKIKPTSLIPAESVAEIKKQVVAKVKDIPADKLTFKKLGDLAPDIIAETIGIPVKKLVDPKANLSKGDANAIQRFVSKNADKLLNILPEGAVLEAATEKLIGTSTGVPKGLLNAFYTKQARVGKGAGLAPFKKNKGITKSDFLKAFGIVEGKKAEDFSARSPEAQALKGIANLYGRLVTNEVVRSETDLDITQKQDVAAGKARLMFSKTDEAEINEFIEKQGFVKTEDELAAENKVWKFIAKQLGVTPISSKNADDVVEFQQWVRDVLAPRIDKSFFTTGTFANAGTSAAERNFYFTSAQELNDLLEGVQFGPESKNIQQAVNRKTYVTGGAEGIVSKKFVKEFNSSEFKKEQQEKLDGLKEVFTVFQELMQEDSNNAKFVIALLTSTSQGMGHFVRTSAPVKFYSKNIEGGIVEEHTMPASLVAKYLFGQAVNGTIDKGFKPIENNYFQGALGKNDDKKLKGKKPDGKPFNYTSMTPEGWKITDNIWARYFNLNVATNDFGIDPNNIVLSDGKTVFEKFGVNSAGHKVSESINETTQKAAKGNNNKLPDVVKVKLSKSNPVVLSEMSKLDEEAADARKQAKFSKASDLDKGFNDIIEAKTGIASEKEYKRVKAEVAGAGKGRFNFFIPPSAEDFVGLLYDTLSKGKLGDSQMAWYKKHLLNPYGRAMNELSSARIALMNDYKQLKKQLKVVPKNLRKKVPGEPYTREQAVRVYIWNKQGMNVPGISKTDLKDLTEYVSDNADLQVFADQLIAMQKGDQYAKPKEGWPAGTITTDLLEGLNTTKRAKYLEQWQNNVDVIFSEKNLNKLQAAYGKDYRKSLENMLQRMKTGRNRNFSGDSLTGKFTDWITGSIGTIMFFNTRSAILQTISAINFVNFTDNNILAAGKAFGNQKQFWSDFLTLANSDFLKERRGGLRINVNEADIADMAKKGGVQGVINKLLEFGFTPTQLADSFAIASGGATFYRNRIKTYEKQGLDPKEAQDKAFVDFREIAEESQQSSRPDRISMQQAGSLGRLVLAFANTPAQYARLIKKAARDLKNGRGDAKTNISKIIYYGVAQNLLFNALQQALFAFAFGDTEPEDEEKEKKYIGIANGMMDSLLRGMGLGGAVISVGKNALKRIYDEMQKKQPKLEKVGYELTKLSPPISAKLSRINQAARSYQWDKKEMAEKGWSLDNPAYLAGANVVSALTNIPLDRAVKKTNNVVQATSQDLETWERMALLGGWSDWEIGINEEKPTNKPQPRKIKKRKIKRKKIK